VGVTWEEADHSDIITCWMPLVDATRENGCMEVIPGVNKLGYLHHQKEGGTMIMPELMPDLPVICAECPRGGVVFMSRFTPHRGLPNVSADTVRWTLDLRFQPTGKPSGRPFYPTFVTHSAADPDSVLTDYDEWCRRWDAGLKAGEGQSWHRSKPREQLLKDLALN
jgi:ectoine hydroxylase-related dioxygenase (phytanoyl-CoA dioxygenase family)